MTGVTELNSNRKMKPNSTAKRHAAQVERTIATLASPASLAPEARPCSAEPLFPNPISPTKVFGWGGPATIFCRPVG